MLNRAVSSYSGLSAAKSQRPLQPIESATNVLQPVDSNKRKHDRTMSSAGGLGALHDSTYLFMENDFDDTIDLTDSPPSAKRRVEVQYPTLAKAVSNIEYPKLPPAPPSQQNGPPSSAPVPWSSSPPSHFEPPRPSKRRTVPWLNKDRNDKTDFTPLPQNKATGERDPWNTTASAVKQQQAELKKRNRERALAKPELNKKSATPKVPVTHLSEEQRRIISMVCDDGSSVFFTGSAGTGKSVLMREIIAKLRMKHRQEPDRIAVTASTGLASCNIEGITLHSFAGIGLGREPAPELIKRIKKNVKTKTRWQRVKVLIVDEISMVDGDLFDKLEQIARAIKNNGRPFGGIQLVLTGDFFQLPPVPEGNRAAKFAFDAATWNTSIEHTILLTHVFRQKDPVFAGMLNEMRLGKLTPQSTQAFQKLSRPLQFEDDIDATELFPTRREVEHANSTKMNMLSGETMTFQASDSGISDLTMRNKLLENFMAQEVLTLKKGAQVMLIKNIDQALVNGSLGKVIAFMDENTCQFYIKDEESYMRAHEPAGGSEEEDNARARKKLQAAKYKDGAAPGKVWPMVRFTLADNTSRTLLCQPEEWKTESPNGEIMAKRMQVPLILAWALSIHKAQGQTLERVKVDLGKVFEKGQAYVALSRATSQAGLQVTRFDQRKVMVHPRVVKFYEELCSVEMLKETKKAQKVLQVDDEEDDDDALAYMYG